MYKFENSSVEAQTSGNNINFVTNNLEKVLNYIISEPRLRPFQEDNAT